MLTAIRYSVHSVVLTGAVFLAAACIQATAEKKVLIGSVEERFEPTGTLEELRVLNLSGSVHIESAPGPNVEIYAEVKVIESRKRDFEPLLFDDHVSVRQEGRQLIIEDAHRHDADQNDWQLALTIRLRHQVRIDAQLGAGNLGVDLRAANGVDVDIGAGNVEIDIGQIAGGIKGRIGAGNFILSVTESPPTEDVEINCSAGNISLSLPEQVNGDFDVTAAVGNVSVTGRYGLPVERRLTSAYVKGSVGTGGPGYKLHTATGTIALK